MNKVKVGIIGCGNISSQYLTHCKTFDILEVFACADLDMDKARLRAEEYEIPQVYTVEELLNDSQIEIVINLTIPAVHAQVNKQALEHGKHVYVEKPFAATIEAGQQVLDLAKQNGLLLGSAPDTVLGAGIQTCRKLIDDGWIGEPLSATAFMMCGGHESWHPDPEFYYQVGGGPLFDMGPYYLSSLVQLLGPIQTVSSMAKMTYEQRTITSQPKAGQIMNVETPTHIAGNLGFASGAIGTMIMSFDVFAGHQLPCIEIYGSEGSLQVPDPNTFNGRVQMSRKGNKEWKEVPYSHPYGESGRGLGVADLAYAIRTGRMNRANGELGYHVLESMHGFLESAEKGHLYAMQSNCQRPTPMPMSGLNR